MMVIVALGTTAPVESVSVPCTLPVAVVLCASRGVVTKIMDASNMTIWIARNGLATGFHDIPHPRVRIRMFCFDLALPTPAPQARLDSKQTEVRWPKCKSNATGIPNRQEGSSRKCAGGKKILFWSRFKFRILAQAEGPNT